MRFQWFVLTEGNSWQRGGRQEGSFGEGGCAAKLLCTVVLCLLPYGCRPWAIPPCCTGPYCKAGELLCQALSHGLS